MRLVVAIVGTVMLNAAAARAQSAACVPYAPENVVLIGIVTRTMAYGPPGFGETPRIDAKEPFLSLDLAQPVCVAQGDSPAEPAEGSIRHMQILFGGSVPYDGSLAGHRVQVTGLLSHAYSGHHHTAVMVSPVRVVRLQ